MSRIVLPLFLLLASSPVALGQAVPQQQNPFFGGRVDAPATSTPLRLTVKDAIERALRQNLGLLLQEETVADAHGARWRALADLLPTAAAGVTETRQVLNLEAFGFPAPDPLVGPFNVFDARLYVSQPLIDLRALNEARSASIHERAETRGIKTARELVVLVTVNLYLEAVTASSRVEAVQAQLQTAEALYKQASDLKAAGLVAGVDVLRSQVQVQTQRQRSIAAANEFEKKKLQLARAIGLSVAQPIVLTDKIPFAPIPDVDLETTVKRALETRADYLAARDRVEAAHASQRAANGALFPTLHLDADWGALGQTVPAAHMTYRIAANVRVPLFDADRTVAKRVEADADVRRREAELADFRNRVELEVRSAALDLRAAGQQVETAQSSISLANQELEQARDRFAAGVASNLEITQAQESVAFATESYINAIYAHNLARASLARAVGIAEDAIIAFVGGMK